MSDMKFCSHCGTPTEPDAVFCSECGRPLEIEAQPVPADPSIPVSAQSATLSSQSSNLSDDNILVPAPGQTAIVIGREPSLRGTDHCYLDHPAVSNEHARIEMRDGRWYVVDLDSAKGTFVNYHRVEPGEAGYPITERDIIWVAPFAFRLCISGNRGTLQPANMRLDAQGLRRSVRVGSQELCILDIRNTPLAFIPGEFIALVGGSGSGKSTLIKALNGLAPAQEGQILIDGHPIISGGDASPFTALYSIVGYVPQDDIMYRELTVNELLHSVAKLRLADLSDVDIALTIEDTLGAVDLREHSRKRIYQLSGGQRKRVNIAMELLAEPRLLFLDEPTSGLDPGLDLDIMNLLRRWARGESVEGERRDPKTIVLVTHATENIELCDYIAFMEPGGHLAYFGPPQEAKTFFFPEQDPNTITFSQLYRRAAEGPPQRDGIQHENWGEIYLESDAYQRYVVERTESVLAEHAETQNAGNTDGRPAWYQEPLKTHLVKLGQMIQKSVQQIAILAKRQFIRTIRDRSNFLFMMLQPPFVAWLLSGVASSQALRRGDDAIDAQKVLFILACAVVWLGVINATKAIVSERDVYQRERRYGLTATPYVLSKFLVLGLIGTVQVILLIISMNFVMDLPRSGVFLSINIEYMITLFFTMAAGLALGLLVSSISNTTDLATTLMFVVLIIQVIFSGLLFAPEGIAEIPAALTISRWSLRALGSSSDLNQLIKSAAPLTYKYDDVYRSESGYLISMWVVLFIYTVSCLILASWKNGRKLKE